MKLDLLFISQQWARIRRDAIHLKLGKAKGFKKLFKTFNKTNVGVDYHNNWHSLVITGMLMIRQLAHKGHKVTVFNRDRSKAEKLSTTSSITLDVVYLLKWNSKIIQ